MINNLTHQYPKTNIATLKSKGGQLIFEYAEKNRKQQKYTFFCLKLFIILYTRSLHMGLNKWTFFSILTIIYGSSCLDSVFYTELFTLWDNLCQTKHQMANTRRKAL